MSQLRCRCLYEAGPQPYSQVPPVLWLLADLLASPSDWKLGESRPPPSRLLIVFSVAPACWQLAHNQQAISTWYLLKEGREGTREPFPAQADRAPHVKTLQHVHLPARRKCGCLCLSRWQDIVHQEQRPRQWWVPCDHGLSEIEFRVIHRMHCTELLRIRMQIRSMLKKLCHGY